MKLSVHSVALFSNDLERSEDFYVDGLGLHVVERTHEALRLLAGETLLVLHRPWRPGWKASAQDIFVTFEVSDLESYYSLLVGRAIAGPEDYGSFEGGPMRIRLKDPDGHEISIQQRA
ncbi:MAG: VOC family protein [Planctomycetes bacterium]|nr:VOC family protein [Planctomycetota bacterium]